MSGPAAPRRPGLRRWLPGRLHIEWGPNRWSVWLLGAVCAILLWQAVAGIGEGLRAQFFWEHTEGTITAITRPSAGRQSPPYAVFVFQTPDGHTMRATTPRSSVFHSGKAGDAVRVAYPTASPGLADLLHPGHLFGAPLLQLLGAAFFAWLSLRQFDGAIHWFSTSEESGAEAEPL